MVFPFMLQQRREMTVADKKAVTVISQAPPAGQPRERQGQFNVAAADTVRPKAIKEEKKENSRTDGHDRRSDEAKAQGQDIADGQDDNGSIGNPIGLDVGIGNGGRSPNANAYQSQKPERFIIY